MTPGKRVLTGTSKSAYSITVTPPRPPGRGVSVSGAYDWRKDALDSFHLALHMKALALGHRRPRTPAEVYYCEAHGAIP